MWLIKPELIEQSTWGGNYIGKLKGIKTDKKIGQSYELFSGTKLINNSEIIDLKTLIEKNPIEILGGKVFEKYGGMPLLIKINQAKGNSFQLHIKKEIVHPKWQAKPETWYFLENGKITCGIEKGISVKDYKNACLEIDLLMKNLSNQIVNHKIKIEEARNKAKVEIEKINPWQFVQNKKTIAGEIYDLSAGGIHHSWEEDKNSDLGNVVYEVQLDVMDPVSTIRSFDQGKIKDDGTIREINIEDYFNFLDTNEETNFGGTIPRKTSLLNAFTTDDYAMDILTITEQRTEETNNSFCHLYIKNGSVSLENDEKKLVIKSGESCFIPAISKIIKISPLEDKSEILKTYVPQ